ncbi:MAG TPA: DNA polymerase/3'-5' exonuclease PolX [Chloroflexota bacterium]|nr:DNA polymerase/3'-5' exonuclease PolX [Chloroflexota bacterium]
MNNAQIAEALDEIGQLLELQEVAVYRVRAYHNAADAVRRWPASVDQMAAQGTLDSIPGVGKAIADKIAELVATGHLRYLDELRAAFPPGLFDLLTVPSLGGKTALRIARELGVGSIEELEIAARSGRIRTLSGLGEKREQAILHNLEVLRRKDQRRPIADVLPLAQQVLATLQASGLAQRLDAAGSLRRFEETIGDLDFIATADDSTALTNHFVAQPMVREVLGQGPAKATVIAQNGVQLDLKVVQPRDYGSLLQHFTGSKTHNIRLREFAQRKQLKVSEYGITDERTGSDEHFETEEGVYRRLGLAYIPPELRQGFDEIERAQSGRLPRLVTRADLRGDLHAHTDQSDGHNTLEEMAAAAKAAGLHYLAICDHSVGRAVANGLSIERLRQQIAAIRAYNATATDGFRLLAGSEVDIRSDGRLDYPDEILAELDIVVASIHSAMQQDKETATRRLLRAIANPYVTIIGHPTARLVGKREPVALDMDAVIAAAARSGTVLEINASLERLDLKDSHARQAQEAGVMLSIDTDAHVTDSLQNLEYGVAVARRAWCAPEQILNSRNADDVLAFARRKREQARQAN